MIRDQLIYVEQAGTLGAIYLRSLTDEPAEKAVRDAIYSNVDLEDEAKTDKVVQETATAAESEDSEPERIERAAIPIQELPAEGVSNKSIDDNLAQVQHKDTFDEESDKSGPGQ